MEKKALAKNEIIQFLKDMALGTERTIMAIDGKEESVMPNLAMGVIKNKYFDSDTTTFLAGVYGSDYEFRSFFAEDYEDEETCISDLVEWLTNEGICYCGNFGGLYIKPTDEEEQSFYEENKFNGDVVREVDTLDYGMVCLVARFYVDEGNFYDMYQKERGGYLGELHTESLESLTDEDIEDIIKRDIQTGW